MTFPTRMRKLTRNVAAAMAIGLVAMPAAHAAINFDFIYLDDPGEGFNDLTSGAQRKSALETAGIEFSNLFSSIFTESGTLTMAVTGSDNPASSTLASAGSELILFGGTPPGFNMGEVVRTKLQTGNDLNGNDADGSVDVNFGQPWELDYNTTPDGSNYDLYSTLFHEFTHALGFASSMDQAGNPLFGDNTNGGNWAAFDQYIVDKNGNTVVDASDYTIDESVWNAASVGGASPAEGLFFNGGFAMAANGGNPVGLYSPTTWEDGSSSAHLDDENPALAGMMMLAATGTGPGARSFSAIEIGMLRDIGYTVAVVPEPESYAMMLAGLAMMGWVSRRRMR